MRRIFALAFTIATLHAAGADAPLPGEALFQKRCSGCHALDSARTGPPLRNVYARQSGADLTFPYSDALKKLSVEWNATNLDRWLKDPDSVAPNNDMSFRLDNAEERAAMIAWLKQIAGK